MKRIIYILMALVSCLALSCKKEVLNVADFGKVVIDSISPGSTPSGTHVVVYGKNFAYLPEDVKVKINQLEGQVIEASLSRMVILLPQGATTGPLQFNFDRKNPTNQQFDYSAQVQPSTIWPSFTINNSLVAMPIINNVEPRNGKAGDVITIAGYNFSSNANLSVLFGDVAGEVTSITGNELKVKVPVSTPATVNLKVQQDSYSIGAGTFVVDETPKGVREVYFAESGSSHISKAVFDDLGNPTIHVLYDANDGVSAPGTALQVDAANGAIYWLDNGVIMKGSTDGSLTPVVFYADPVFTYGFSLDAAAGKIYLSSASSSESGYHSIKRMNADGSGTVDEIYQLANEPMPRHIVVNPASGKLYWAERMTTLIIEGSVNGQTVQPAKTLFDASDGFSGTITFDISPATSTIFIVNGGNKELYSGALDGTGTPTKVPIAKADLGSNPSNIQVDEANQLLYWMSPDYTDGMFLRCKTDGTGFQRIMTGLQNGNIFDLVF